MNYKTLLVLTILLAPVVTFAQYQPLVGIPGIDISSDFNSYINALYKLSISLAALLAVIKIIVAGAKWMLTDLISSTQEAKADIQGAVFGLLIIIAAVLILETINPQLTKTNVFIAPASNIDNSPAIDNRKLTNCVAQWGEGTTINPETGGCNPSQSAINASTTVSKEAEAAACVASTGDGFAWDHVEGRCNSDREIVNPTTIIKNASDCVREHGSFAWDSVTSTCNTNN